ncbi:MAG: MBL fold metallo-hydrolase, partial [Firmicutes bacterium]|nr:MBL fold metallo-hydrolase [Candidatus Fiminaster equi]
MVDIYYSRVACNCYVMYNANNDAFLVDPGYSLNNGLIDHIKKLNKNIKAILITHGHYDHIYALKDVLELYKDAKVYILRDEKDFLVDPSLNLTDKDYNELGIETFSFMPQNIEFLDDGDIINVVGYEIKVIATPFHTKGSCCYYVESEKVLFTGDTLFYTTIGRSDLPTGSNKTISSSLKKLVGLPEGIKVYPGHGFITDLDREKKYN